MNIGYPSLDTFPAANWLPILNDPLVRRRLVPHPEFTPDSAAAWLESKIRLDRTPGHWIRAVTRANRLLGWCGIQHESGAFGLAVVLRPSGWGLGPRILKRLLAEASLRGHAEVAFDLLPTRRLGAFYRLACRDAGRVHLYGFEFHRFLLPVPGASANRQAPRL